MSAILWLANRAVELQGGAKTWCLKDVEVMMRHEERFERQIQASASFSASAPSITTVFKSRSTRQKCVRQFSRIMTAFSTLDAVTHDAQHAMQGEGRYENSPASSKNCLQAFTFQFHNSSLKDCTKMTLCRWTVNWRGFNDERIYFLLTSIRGEK